MLKAHLSWADRHLPGNPREALEPYLDDGARELLRRPILASAWVLFRHLITIDRAIAGAATRGREPSADAEEAVFLSLGSHSAELNLTGVYKVFISDEPHRFFENMSLLHGRFQSFGTSRYQKAGERSGVIRTADYPAYSPVFCSTGRGYYEGALRLMHVPGPIHVVETLCQCAGQEACVYELSW